MKLLVIEHAPGRANGIRETISSSTPSAEVTIAPIYLGMDLPNFKDFDALIPGGGPMGVYEIEKPEYVYIRREVDYIKSAIDAACPIFGICFGHQLITHILGGEVIRDETKSEIGCYQILRTDSDRQSSLFADFPNEFTVFEYHNDRVVKSPADSRILAKSRNCEVQALEYYHYPIRSVQFHPEINAQRGATIFESTRQQLTARGHNVDLLIQESHTITENVGTLIFSNFLRLLG